MTGPPVRVLLDVCDVVHVGLDTLLHPYRDRVHVVDRLDLAPVDVEVFDPGDDRVPSRSPGGSAPRVGLSWDPSARSVDRARELGAVLVLPMSVPVGDLVDALERVHRDPSARSGPHRVSVLPLPAPPATSGPPAPPPAPPAPLTPPATMTPLTPLSPREVDVVRLICRGLSNLEIAAELDLSVNSVKTYIRTAYRKMKVESRSQAVLWGVVHVL